AILVVQSSGLAIDGISLVFGNATLQAVCGNAAGAVAAFGWSMPIHQGRAMPVLGALETAQCILGENGIPTVGQSLPDAAALPKSDAFAALCAWLEGEGERRILALGP
ncbi:nucleoside hydrolase, partial [bacterium M00.F.Ca.ET.141.01.1.1]